MNENTGLVNSPQVDSKASKPKPKVRAIKDAGQAHSLFKSLESQNAERNLKNARIMAKYNAEQPHKPSDLAAEGLSWKSNFSTKPLAILIDRVAPRFSTAVDSLRYFTSSALPDDAPGASAKTEAFRRAITDTIRARPEWSDFVRDLAQENALFGYTSAAWLNEFEWFPKHFRQDTFFVPSVTLQNARFATVVGIKETYFPHELFELVSDKEAAIDAGWEWENVIETINAAMPEGLRSTYSDTARIYEDLVREANVASAYSDGAKVCVVDTVLVTELDGKVSHWRVDHTSGKLLFRRDDRFDRMDDCLHFFSFQQGSGKLMGSKGVGREVYNIAAVLDRSRNEAMDRLQMAGKILVQCDEREMRRFRATVRGPALLIGSEYKVEEQKIQADAQDFLVLDQYLANLLDQMAGNVSPQQLKGERVTAKQVELYAAREEESKDNVLTRFLSQFSGLISRMQRKLCDPKVTEDDAVALREKLLKLMSKEELKQLAEQPSARVVQDFSERERQQIILTASEGRGHPLYNQKELERRKLTAQVNGEFAEAVLLPDNDPTETAEQVRLQQMEGLVLDAGQPVPVSPRDNHRIHLDTIKEILDAALPSLADQPERAKLFRLYIKHAREHVSAGSKLAGQAGGFSGDAAWLAELETKLQALEQHEQELAAGQVPGVPPEMALPPEISNAMPPEMAAVGMPA